MINHRKYKIKEKILGDLNKRFRDVMDNPEPFNEKEINGIIEEIIKNSIPSDILEPFNPEIVPLGRNDKGTKDLYHNKRYYYEHAFPKGFKPESQDSISGDAVDDMSEYQGESRNVFPEFQSIDFIHEKMLYGRIDTHNRPIYPSNKFLKLVPGTQDVLLLDFVCEALIDMLDKINRMKEIKKLSKKSAYYSFQIKTGWSDSLADHHKTMESLFQGFIRKYAKQGSSKIKNYRDYIKEFTLFLDVLLPVFPMTRSNLQLRRASNPAMSGIVFEISDAKHDDDKKKYTSFILDEHFLQIQKIANAFGFMVDRNAPWRFIADLESPQMSDRMGDKGYASLQDMFDKCYYQTHFFEISALKKYMLSFYDSYVEAFPYYTETKVCGQGSKSKLTYRKKRIETDFTDRKLIELYYFIRAKEAKKEWNQDYFDLSVEEAFEVFQHYGLTECLHHIHDKTCLIVGDGANYGVRTKKEENYRIFSTHQPYRKKTFTIKL